MSIKTKIQKNNEAISKLEKSFNLINGLIKPLEQTPTQTKSPQSKTVTPTTSQQVVTADTGFYLSSVTVNKIPDNYTSAITGVKYDGGELTVQDSDVSTLFIYDNLTGVINMYADNSIEVYAECNIRVGENGVINANSLSPENIKQGVNILGVTGTYEGNSTGGIDGVEVSGTEDNEIVTITADNEFISMHYYAGNNGDGFTIFTHDDVDIETQPNTNAYISVLGNATIVNDGQGTITSNNLTAENIKKDVDILGVVGNYEGNPTGGITTTDGVTLALAPDNYSSAGYPHIYWFVTKHPSLNCYMLWLGQMPFGYYQDGNEIWQIKYNTGALSSISYYVGEIDFDNLEAEWAMQSSKQSSSISVGSGVTIVASNHDIKTYVGGKNISNASMVNYFKHNNV